MTMHTHRAAAMATAVLAASLPAAAQPAHFQPFASASAEASVAGRYDAILIQDSQLLSRDSEFSLTTPDTRGVLRLDTATESGHAAVYGTDASLRWAVHIDSTPFDYTTSPAPLPRIIAWEWDFDIDIEGHAECNGTASLDVAFELTRPTTLTLRADSETPFEAYLRSEHDTLLAATRYFTFIGDQGTMSADGRTHQTITLAPGRYTIALDASEIADAENYRPADAGLTLRFEPAGCEGDLNRDGVSDTADIAVFIAAFLAGC
ncbi:MAG: hypothetical protein ACF8Q5_05715 [Phycisphaerales bacterium JB040]